MGLRETAQTDLGRIVEDSDYGFGWDVSITNPAGNTVPLIGLTNDIALQVDPDTGMLVSGRTATLAIRIQYLTDNGLGLPVGIADTDGTPWVITFNDVNGNSFTFTVQQSNPDRAIGLVTLNLALYEEA